MLDIALIREKPEEIRQALLKRMDEVNFTELLAWDQQRRGLIQEAESLKAERNQISGEVGRLRREGQPAEAIIERMQGVSARIKALDAQLAGLEEQIQQMLAGLPNVPDEDVPPGDKENNLTISQWGQRPQFDFIPKDHVELVTSLGLVDYERGVKLGGNGFWLYRGHGARLEWGLLNYFIQAHLQDGYELVLPPHILTYES